MYVRIWEFRVKPGNEAEFRTTYGPRGSWTELFGSAGGYLGTELLASTMDSAIFVTIDRWESEAAWQTFLRTWTDDYQTLDRACEALTESEREIGQFRVSDR
jgi:heme-degrading monooxygenase HmoA